MVTKFGMSKIKGLMVMGAVAAIMLAGSSMAMAAGDPATPEAPKAMSAQHIIFATFDYGVILILISASIGGIAFIIDGCMRIRESRIAPAETTEHLRSLINARQFKELLEFTATDQSYVSQSLNAGLRRAHLGYPAMREAMESSAGEQSANYFRRIEFLNIIGNIGPLIGLLGTVLGMIMAFNAMKEAGGNPKPGDLSGGIATALWHTFGGLGVAIPCLVAFGFLRTKVDAITTKAGVVTEELLESLRPAEGKSALGGSASDDSRTPSAKPAPRRVAAPSAE